MTKRFEQKGKVLDVTERSKGLQGWLDLGFNNATLTIKDSLNWRIITFYIVLVLPCLNMQ